jgi:hypothetical protein
MEKESWVREQMKENATVLVSGASVSDSGKRETTRWSMGPRLLVREGGVGRWVLWLRGEGWSVLVSGWVRGRRKKKSAGRGLRLPLFVRE